MPDGGTGGLEKDPGLLSHLLGRGSLGEGRRQVRAGQVPAGVGRGAERD